jgi:hypothetical protein
VVDLLLRLIERHLAICLRLLADKSAPNQFDGNDNRAANPPTIAPADRLQSRHGGPRAG